MKTVKITKHVPLQVNGGYSEVKFTSGAHGKKEKGIYRFWTAVGEDKYGDWKCTGRAKKNLDAGERFRRIGKEQFTAEEADARAAYKRMWRLLKTATLVRPATEREVRSWLASHSDDSPYAESKALIQGKSRKVSARLV